MWSWKPKEDSNAYKQKEKSLYEKEVQEKILSLLKAPETPLKTPDIIMRILILPYADQNGSLVSNHYIFVKMKEGKWILGDYLIDKNKEEKRIIRPLKEEHNSPDKQTNQQTTQSNQTSPTQEPNQETSSINSQEAQQVKQQMEMMRNSISAGE